MNTGMNAEIKTVGLIGLGAVGALYSERLLESGADLRVMTLPEPFAEAILKQNK